MADKIVFNPFTSNFDYVGSSSGGSSTFLPPVQSETDLPIGSDPDGAVRVVKDTERVYVYNLTDSVWTDSGVLADTFSLSPTNEGIEVNQITDGDIIRTAISVSPADATHPGSISINDQTFSGIKSFDDGAKTNSIDVLNSGDTLALGISDAAIINIGSSISTTNLNGDVNVNNVTNLDVTDKLITTNVGGGVGSASDSGLQMQENGSITGFVKTSADRASMRIKAPANAGEILLNPSTAAVNSIISSDATSSRTYTLPDVSGDFVLTEGDQIINGNKTFTNDISTPGIENSSSEELISLDNEVITAVGGSTSVDWGNRRLTASNSSSSVDWENRALSDGVVGSQLNWSASGVQLPNLTASTVPYLDASQIITSSAVTPTELGYVSGVTSAIQTQLNLKADKSIQILAGTGLSGGGDLSTNRTISMPNVGTAGTYGSASNVPVLTTDTQGRISSVTNTPIVITAGSITGFDESAQDAVGGILGTTSTVTLTYSDATPSIIADVNDASITDTKLTTGINANKIGAGSVDNTEFNYLDGVTSSIQTQLGSKQATITGAATTIVTLDLTTNRALISNGSGKVAVSTVTDTELGYVSGVTSSIQTQLNSLVTSGDIGLTSFTAADNQVSPANITGLTFSNATIRSFEATVSIVRSSTYAQYKLNGIQKASSWEMTQNLVGDDTGLIFSVTTAGAIQYTSTSTGSTADVRFRAIITNV